jgi:multiple sugar transport system substrate-binding protein
MNTVPNSPMAVSRRRFLALGTGAAAMLAMAGCAVQPPRPGGGSADGAVRFAWWGNSSRQEIFSNFANGFTKNNPNATVKLEPAEYSAYTDRLSVQAAGRNLPDVLWMPANQSLTYASRGALYDLGQLPDGVVDWSPFPSSQIDSWKLAGKQFGPVYSQYSPATQLDVTAFKAAGITDFPDDESWTWDDLMSLGVDYAKARGEGNWGISNQSTFYQHAHLWLRQNGAEAFTADGEIGFDADVLGSWFDWWQRATAAGAVMPTAISAGKSQWTQTGGKTAIYLVQLNQFQDNAAFSKQNELRLVKSPEVPGSTKDYQFKYYTRLCVAANTGDPELAGKFLNYLLNDPSNAEIVGLASGVPSNPDIVKAIAEKASDTDKKILDITARIDQQPSRPRAEPPVGASGWQSLIEKAGDDIFNGGVPIAEAVQQGIKTLQAEIDRG